MINKRLRGVAVGAGYFSRFHYEAWNRIEQVEMVALFDLDENKALKMAREYNIPKIYNSYEKMIEYEKPDFIDIITPPESHLEICTYAANQKLNIICQKPLAPELFEALEIVEAINKQGVRFMVHENFRFQPWHREIKKILEKNEIGDLHFMNFRCRMGDGWSEKAYMDRQPYFREMPRLFIHETGIHFIDVFRFLAGDIVRVNAHFKRLNNNIQGEDSAFVTFEFKEPVFGVLDANRYNESAYKNPRYTFGEFLLEGTKGAIELSANGKIRIRKLGVPAKDHHYEYRDHGFSGDCCYFTQKHFIEGLIQDTEFETNGNDYLKNIQVEEAVYQSASAGLPQVIKYS